VMSFAKGTNLVAHWAMAGMGRGRPAWIAREGNNIARATADEASGSLARKAAMALTRRAYRAADRVLVNSHEMAAGTARELGLDPARLRVINNPTDVDAIRRAAAEPLADPPVRPFIVSVGRLERQKGHDLLLRAFAAGRARQGHDLVILGEGAAAGSLAALAASLGIADRVRFEPFTDNPWAWVKRARLFVLPSRWEGFPNALAEALACGTASLAADCRYGPSELIAHGESGWLVPSEDVEALGAAIDRLIADPALCASLGGEGRRRIEAFRLETIVPLYADLLREQLACTARRSAAAAGGSADGPALALESAD
jgi:glycosyltransferase involved in cell wall biosynthesis